VVFENIEKASNATVDLFDAGYRPEVLFIEDFSRFYYNVVESKPSLDGAVREALGDTDAFLIIGFAGSSGYVDTNRDEALKLLSKIGGERLDNAPIVDAWWFTKTQLLFQMPPELVEGKSQIATSDACIPIGALPWWNEQYKESTKKYGLFAGGLRGYVGPNHDLIMAQRVVFNDADPEDVKNFLGWAKELSKLAVDIGGSMTSNLGVGSKLVDIVDYELQESAPVMRVIKKTFDPNDIMNRGKKL